MIWLCGTLHRLLCVNIFQSSISIVEMDASSIKITSVVLLIIALLKALFRNGCNVGMVDESKDWLKETSLSALGVPN